MTVATPTNAAQWIEAPLDYVGPAGIAALAGAMLLTVHGHAGVGSIPAVVAAVSAFVIVRVPQRLFCASPRHHESRPRRPARHRSPCSPGCCPARSATR